MADRILVVTVRKQGWEQLRAAKLAKNICQSKKSSTETGKAEDEALSDEDSDIEIDKTAEIKGKNQSEETEAGGVTPGTLVDITNEALGNKGPEPSPAFDVDRGKVSDGEKKPKCATKRKKNKSDDSFTMPDDIYKFTFDSIPQSTNGTDLEEIPGKENDKSQCNTSIAHNNCRETLPQVEPERELCDGTETCKIDDIHDLDVPESVVREYEIHVHSFWLALNSSYFRGLFFSSGMKETRNKKVSINVTEDMSAMFMILIESLYRPDVVINKSVDDLLILMRLSLIYDADSTLKCCQRLLSTAELSIPICDKALNMQEHERLSEMDEFIKRCEQHLVEAFSPLDYQWTREEFFSLSATALKSVLGSNELCVSSENTVFLALMRWAEMNEVLDEGLEPLLNHVCFKAMTINYLHDVVTSAHPIASTVEKFPLLFEEAVFFHAFSKERQAEEGDYEPRKAFEEPILFNWHVENYEDTEFEKKKKIVKSPHFWVSGYEMFLELKLRSSGFQGLYLTICTQQFNHNSKGFVKLKYSLSSNFLKATHVFNEVDIFDKEGSGWGYEEFFPLTWPEFRDQLKRSPLIITAQVRLLE
ncbi:predicted protein [Nematostella vectensis]|uniref:Uncharacterized protein n=2 Tax=Nematostella vectensis TaxID=45351 RepID=A7SYY1_NEMVE|nr:predicted protein [Nematostella vectensis]|eukprot:XP_001623193.1 predicted protein [Nematostella vectensis]